MTMFPATLAAYVPLLRETDDLHRLRLVAHEFGLRWEDAPLPERPALVAEEPGPVTPPWDAFLAAYAEYRCYHDRLPAPDWVFGPGRYLEGFWFILPPQWRVMRWEDRVHSPAAFEAHGTLIAERELAVV